MRLLLNAKADLGLTPDQQVASVSTTPLDVISKTPPGYAIKYENTEILDVLLQYGLADKYDMEVLLQVAMKNSSLKCVRILLESGHVVKYSHDTFLAAHLQGLPYVQSLIEGGYSYSTSFLESHPDVLHLYYSKAGICHDHSTPDPCWHITKLILTEHKCGNVLGEHINAELLHALLKRMRLRKRRRKGYSKVDAQNFFNDLEDTIDELLVYRPELLKAMDMNSLSTHVKTSDINHMEIVCYVQFICFLMERGHHISTEILLKVLISDVTTLNQSELVSTYCQLLHQGLLQENACQTFQLWINKICSSHFRNLIWRESCHMVNYELSLISRSLGVLYGHGLDIYMLGINTYEAITSCRPSNQTNETITYTFLQKMCLQYFNFIWTNDEKDIIYVHMLEMLILVAGQLVDFEREKKSYSIGYQEMFESMAAVVGHQESLYTQDGAEIPHNGKFKTTPAMVQICRHFLSLLLPHNRRGAALPILTQYSREPEALAPRYKADIEKVLAEQIKPLLQVQTLAEHCCLYIRKYLFAGNSNNITHCYQGLRFQNGGNMGVEVGEDADETPKLVRDGNGMLFDLESKGLCVDPQTTLLTRLQTLPLPVQLKQRILGYDDIESTIEQIRTITN